jgi:hypothetical protein
MSRTVCVLPASTTRRVSPSCQERTVASRGAAGAGASRRTASSTAAARDCKTWRCGTGYLSRGWFYGRVPCPAAWPGSIARRTRPPGRGPGGAAATCGGSRSSCGLRVRLGSSTTGGGGILLWGACSRRSSRGGGQRILNLSVLPRLLKRGKSSSVATGLPRRSGRSYGGCGGRFGSCGKSGRS